MIFHETNTYSPFSTGVENFRKRCYVNGDEVIRYYENTHTVIGAYIETLRANAVEIIPAVAAMAEPSGIVEETAFEQMLQELLAPLACDKVDGVLLALHGAMVTEADEDGDGLILQEVRKRVGPNVPIMATLDLHTNLTERMVSMANVLIPYNQYPHADMYERGRKTAELMMRMLRGEIRPVMEWKQLPVLPTLTVTAEKPYLPIRQKIEELEKCPGILNACVMHGFYLADTADTGASALCIADGDSACARDAATELGRAFWDHRASFVEVETYTVEEALQDAAALEGGPVTFADISDNPGVGSTCDGTYLLRELIERNVQDAAYAHIVDPESVAMCAAVGVGRYVDLSLGGKAYPEKLGAPIRCRAYVKAVIDGKYHNRGPMHGGLGVSIGRSAVIIIGGITVIVSSAATQAYDVEIFQSSGLTLSDYKILVVKSSVHYRAAFGKVSKKLYAIDCPGMLVTNPKDIVYKRMVRKVYPIQGDVTWQE